MHEQDCIFCKIIAGQIPGKIIYETEFSIVLQDVAPKAPIHYLILPKKHVQDLTHLSSDDQALMIDMMLIPSHLAQKIGPDTSYRLLVNNGYAAGQRVFHLHLHFLSGKVYSE